MQTASGEPIPIFHVARFLTTPRDVLTLAHLHKDEAWRVDVYRGVHELRVASPAPQAAELIGNCRNLKTLDIYSDPRAPFPFPPPPSGHHSLEVFQGLEHLVIRSRYDSRTADTIGICRGLKTLCIYSSGPRVPAPDLSGHTRLERLSLPWFKGVDDEYLRTGLPRGALRALCIQACTLTDLRPLASCTRLEELDASYSSGITDESIGHLQPLPGLRSLDLTACRSLTDKALELLRGHTRLHRLLLAGNGLTDDGIRHLQPLAGLRALHLNLCDHLTDGALQSLQNLPGLEALVLSGPGFTNGGLLHLRSLPNLQLLRIKYPQHTPNITRGGLQALKQASESESLLVESESESLLRRVLRSHR